MSYRQRAIMMLQIAIFVLFTTSTMGLMEFDEISDKYCDPENISDEVMVAIEKCYQLTSIDFNVSFNFFKYFLLLIMIFKQGMNPYTECKSQIFTKNEVYGEIRNSLCTDEDLDETVSIKIVFSTEFLFQYFLSV